MREGRYDGSFDVGRVLCRYLGWVLPAVDKELSGWLALAEQIPDAKLRQQALLSIGRKRFHCQGGAVYAAGAGRYGSEVLRFIVAFQTISDYLDNLCDRAGVQDRTAFRNLHRSMLHAINPRAVVRHDECRTDPAGYYRLYPCWRDGGYLDTLVRTCQEVVNCLPYYCQVYPKVRHRTRLYCDLQAFKHGPIEQRVPLLQGWFSREWEGSGLLWQEFAAATGSTLGVFALCQAATGRESPRSGRLLDFYFPWTAGLHIMLDYFIDQDEDVAAGDLNFVSFYPSMAVAEERLGYLYDEAVRRLPGLDSYGVHAAVLHGLLALYLSDQKVRSQKYTAMARRLVSGGGIVPTLLHLLCAAYR